MSALRAKYKGSPPRGMKRVRPDPRFSLYVFAPLTEQDKEWLKNGLCVKPFLKHSYTGGMWFGPYSQRNNYCLRCGFSFLEMQRRRLAHPEEVALITKQSRLDKAIAKLNLALRPYGYRQDLS